MNFRRFSPSPLRPSVFREYRPRLMPLVIAMMACLLMAVFAFIALKGAMGSLSLGFAISTFVLVAATFLTYPSRLREKEMQEREGSEGRGRFTGELNLDS